MVAVCRCSYWLDIQTASPPADNPKAQDDGEHAIQDNKQHATIGRPPLKPSQQTPGGPPSPAPALEFGLTSSGAVTIINVPQLPAESPPWSPQDLISQRSVTQGFRTNNSAQLSATQDPAVSATSMSAAQGSAAQGSDTPASKHLRLELDLKTCDTQQLLLMAAASNASVQLGEYVIHTNLS